MREYPEEGSHCADVERMSGDAHDVVLDAGHLGEEH
jgi:hypothetical protein